ncbi:MAG: alanyl-tRNA editing protein [Eubacterium sp.]|nr:alanyl-tRNA editing protein [Eubacterium sp.]
MQTTKLYRSNVYKREADAKILEHTVSNDGKSLLVLNQSIFFPTGGGQSCDLGKINTFDVVDVYEKDNIIYHKLSEYSNELEIGDTVSLKIDWERRFDNMQRHCGEHILSGICFRLFGGINRGFHMGDDYMTIDISLEADENIKEISWDMAMRAELETNKVIWANMPVTVHHFAKKADADGMKLRKPLSIEEDISIVTIGDTSNPSDSVACCGTHPSTAGQVGLLKIYKVEPNKGMYRIFFEAGRRALSHYDKRFDVLTKLENEFSAGFNDLMQKYESRKEKAKQIKDRLYRLSKEFISGEINDIAKTGDTVRHYHIITADDIIEIGRGLSGKIPNILYLIDDVSHTVFLFSDNADCGKLVKDNANVFGGKGGGNKNFARAIFTDSENACLFIDAAEKLRRK